MPQIKLDFLRRSRETEFSVEKGDFTELDIRPARDGKFYYFCDRASRRLVKDFLLREGTQVDTLCGVILIPKEDHFTPRLTFWKRDKTKGDSSATTEEELAAEGRTVIIRARVDLGECHENLWKLVDFLQAYKDIELPSFDFRVVEDEQLVLAQAFAGHDKDVVLNALKVYLAGKVTEQDIQMLLDRRNTLDRFKRLLEDPDFFSDEKERLITGPEGVWQKFFEENTWIFGYGLMLLACAAYSDGKLEQITTGSNIFTGGGKRSDAVMRTKGIIQSVLFAEIKTHATRLLSPRPHTESRTYIKLQQS